MCAPTWPATSRHRSTAHSAPQAFRLSFTAGTGIKAGGSTVVCCGPHRCGIPPGFAIRVALAVKRSKRTVLSTVTAYAATSATEPLTKTTITRRDVRPHDVAFDIHFAGICHSDIHTVKAEWGQPN